MSHGPTFGINEHAFIYPDNLHFFCRLSKLVTFVPSAMNLRATVKNILNICRSRPSTWFEGLEDTFSPVEGSAELSLSERQARGGATTSPLSGPKP